MTETLARFLIGGVVVSLFAALGDLFKPKSFAGLFGAAPSVALATLVLAVHNHGPSYASIEGRSMLAGALALFFYSICVSRLLMRGRLGPLGATLSSLLLWFAGAFGLWFLLWGRPTT